MQFEFKILKTVLCFGDILESTQTSQWNMLWCTTNYLNFAFRYGKIKERFLEVYGVQPSFYARAPGRVNLIGKFNTLMVHNLVSTNFCIY
jgi:hypothetical protein